MRKTVFDEMNAPESECQLQSIEDSIGMITCGFKNQSIQLLNHAKNNAQNFRQKFNKTIPLRKLCDDLSCFINQRSFMAFKSPFCVNVILCTWSENNKAELYCVEPSGESRGYFGCAVGKWKKEAKDEISKLNFDSLSLKESLAGALKVMETISNLELHENKSILSAVWIGGETGGKLMSYKKHQN